MSLIDFVTIREVSQGHLYAGLMGHLFLGLNLLGILRKFYNIVILMSIVSKHAAFAWVQPNGLVFSRWNSNAFLKYIRIPTNIHPSGHVRPADTIHSSEHVWLDVVISSIL